MDALILEWLNLAFRWFHVVAGIAWIGASFYFIWLDLSLREPPAWKAKQGIKGDLWAIHGGGIYEVAKYHLRPQDMPSTLHWFKWEAYTTWLSGTGLLILLYYLQAQTYLVGHNTWILSPAVAIIASVSFMVIGQLVYECLLRTPLVKNGWAFAAALLVVIGFASWMAHQCFSPRAAYLHVGALMATWMAGNVFWGIIPAQRQFVQAVSENLPPNTDAMAFAKLRSTHNNYLTLPVIFCMISNHYPFVYGHAHAWLALVGIGGCLAWGRHFFNLKHLGNRKPLILWTSGAGLLLIAIVMANTGIQKVQAGVPAIPTPVIETQIAQVKNTAPVSHNSDAPIQKLVQHHCTNCHSNTPTQPGFNAAPAGLVIETLEQLGAQKIRALPSIASGYMPLGNFTQLSSEERQQLMDWLQEH
ncbi:urate hydroxylase PuuD [Cellvibrio japonicus]|uniref:Putative membrane protein n=1 Tax=Cellvibrio japonicus (strain Ueda107) TaxID=498211 RepID=B3PJ41_CELJU|nr:urate hydroxylase PuuD [Cellvibrio japonicus]ACE85397.1 putative membrane protein [Cellvibrio japonicus Ueda107]QEI11241.1 hypothetical protein FY117_02660 [Cellvibrio japonicus]QEI14815.1 hypothetical protein FY116_02660 [Cellvibrio japonicus]QEI18395.1 hypothetical protein FY115_02660 [Cellvibrio japonicus]